MDGPVKRSRARGSIHLYLSKVYYYSCTDVQGQFNQICPLYLCNKKLTLFVMLIARNIKIIPIHQEYAWIDWDTSTNDLNKTDILLKKCWVFLRGPNKTLIMIESAA